MTIDVAEWWIIGICLGIALVFLLVGIIALVAYTRMQQERDQALREIESLRAELAESQEKLEEARRERDQTQQELEEARRQLEHANRRMMPRLEIHTAKMSELMEMLKSAREDRQKLGELIAGYRKMADKGLGVLKRLVERPRFRAAADTEEGTPGAE
ncbi:MAG: hypothetical protein OXC98_13080 [bacterium]|nr:hypothetical protein [Acidimicrobiia bacterium]MCY4651274.1 hypothetical protein [bacterium]